MSARVAVDPNPLGPLHGVQRLSEDRRFIRYKTN